MPLTSPDVISDCVSLSDKLGRAVRTFVPEYRAVDAFLAAGVDELPPDKESVGISSSQDDLLSRAGKQVSLPAVAVSVAGVMTLVEFEAGDITVFRQIPERLRRTLAHSEPSS